MRHRLVARSARGLLVYLLALSLGPLVLLLAWSDYRWACARIERERLAGLELARGAAAAFADFADDVTRAVMSDVAISDSGSRSKLEVELAAAARSREDLRALHLAAEDGSLRASSIGPGAGKGIGRELAKAAVDAAGWVAGELLEGDEPGFCLAQAVAAANGQRPGILVAEVPASCLSAVFDRFAGPSGAKVALVDSRGACVFPQPPPAFLQGERDKDPLVKTLGGRAESGWTRDPDLGLLLVSWTPVADSRWLAGSYLPVSRIAGPLLAHFAVEGAGLLLVLLATALVVRRGCSRLDVGFDGLRAQVAQLGRGHLDARAARCEIRELDDLGLQLESAASRWRAAYETVRRSEERFHLAVDNIPDLVAIYDGERRIQFVNAAVLRLSGRQRAELVGRRDEEIFPPEVAGAYVPVLQRALETRQAQWHQPTFPRGGERASFICIFVPVCGPGGKVDQLLAVAHDVTWLKRVEAEFKALNETLELRVRERTEIAEQRARQLRELAVELAGAEQRERRRLAEVLHDHLQQLLVAARMWLAKARDSSGAGRPERLGKADELLLQAIAASRSLSAELSPPILSDPDFGAAMRWLAAWMRDQHGLEVAVELDEVPFGAGGTTRSFLFQAARECLFNVVKHARVDRAWLRLHGEGGWLHVTVADQGAGFDPARLRGGAGGLGLSSVVERLRLVGGRVEIHSAPGAGTRVDLAAPMDSDAAGAERERREPAPEPDARDPTGAWRQ